jgi:hypothetical protein
MINSRILNTTTLATTTCNSNILEVLNNKMNGNKVAAKHVLAEHDEQKNSSTLHVPFACRCSRSRNVVDDNVGEDRSKKTTMKTAVGSTSRLGWKTTRDEELEQLCRALPKNLIHPLPYRIAKVSGSGDLLSRAPVHADARDEVDYGGGASSERWQSTRSILG